MSETTPETNDEYQPSADDADKRVYMKRSNIDALEAKARRAETAERKLAFYEAGIKLDDPRMGYFVKGYEGDLNAEAIRTAAIDAGFLDKPQATQAEVEAQTSAEAAQRVANASTSQAPPPASRSDREREYAEALATGGPQGLAAAAAKYGAVIGRNL